MRKILLSLGTIGAIVTPIAATVACGNSNASLIVATKFTAQQQKDFVHDMWQWTKDAAFTITPATAPITATLSEDDVAKYWNKPEGEGIRLSAITRAIGEKLWNVDTSSIGASDQVIAAILNGVNTASGLTDGSTLLNEYKVQLIQNIHRTLNKYDIRSSLGKFDAFLKWMISPKDHYANLKETLMGGKINQWFMYGVQDSLNQNGGGNNITVVEKPTKQTTNGGVQTTNNGNNTTNANGHDYAFFANMTDAQWVDFWFNEPTIWKDAKTQPQQMPAFASSSAFVQAVLDQPLASLDLDGDGTNDTPGAFYRTKIVTASLGFIWGVDAQTAVDKLETTVASSNVLGLMGGMTIKTNITNAEKKSIGSITDFKNFILSIMNPANSYKTLKDIIQLKSDELIKLQDAIKTLNPSTTVDITK